MKFIKGVAIGMALGVTVGIVLGASNADCVFQMVRNGKRELKRFKRKYI